MGHIHDVYDTNRHFAIDPVTRTITYAGSDKLILIQNDHNSERYTFEIPKMIEGHDMSNCDKVEIHYLNSDVSATNKAPGVYQAEDVQVVEGDEGTVVFSWLISRNATKYSGFLMFAINFECLAVDGTVDYAWATTPFETVRILSSMHNTETVLEPYPDIIEQMRLELIDKVTPKKGVDYFDGVNGKSAYQIAVDNGFIGTEAEWLASLRGADGKDGVQPDWNQNDNTQPNYVKNRPFYTGDPVETVLFKESTIPFVDNGGLYMTEFPSTFEATVGETYKVSWDGTIYERTCVEANVIGNLSILGKGSDTGEPFIMIIRGGNENYIFTADTSVSHTLSISGTVTEIVKIPAKFIDKDASGYIVVHKSDTMTEEEANNYIRALSKGEAVFISWESLCIYNISIGTATDSTGASVVYLDLCIPNGEIYRIAQNSEGLFSSRDRKLSRANFPAYKANGEKNPDIGIINNKVSIFPSEVWTGVGKTNTLFSVNANGTKSKNFDVLGNGEAVAPAIILYSSTPDSTKKFRITVDDTGTISANEVT